MLFENDNVQECHKHYYYATMEIKDYNVMIHGRNFFDQPLKNDSKSYDNIKKIATGRGDYYTKRCLLDYPYFKEY